MISRIDKTIKGSIGVFIYEGLPSIPLFIIISNESRKVKVYNSFYLTEPVSKMPYFNWESELKVGSQPSFESEHWNIADLFLDYLKKRWEMEKKYPMIPLEANKLKTIILSMPQPQLNKNVPILFRIS